MVDTVSIVPDKLLLSSNFPTDPAQAQSLLLDLRVTHFVTISPADIPSAAGAVVPHRHFVVDKTSPESLLLALPAICSYIYEALKGDGLVFVHSSRESHACAAVCAYPVMATKRCSASDVLDVIERALPLFHRTQSLSHTLELYQACGYLPTSTHPAVKELKNPSNAGTRTVHDLGKTANTILSETAFDLGAFSDALNSIQTDALNSIQGKRHSVVRVL
ncbi:hypothetical protein M413DRAFT_241482 [Hebeloma cylindrosporum]|uniref:Protein-tyrosine-phosphatase n=1 Tax=Hebeloma cylindrosporum TaxID=76867 RepID=A0A0C2YCL0_HEBCY|nr:hypothetical protein M413DRAFT_241482 [Hebeloma cylindrosporum h7]